MSAVVPLARRSAQPQRGMERLLRRGVARLFPSYIDPRSLAEAAGATLPLQISDARAVQLVAQLASKKKNLFLPMSDEPLLAGAALVAAANGTLRAEAVAFVDVAQQRNT